MSTLSVLLDLLREEDPEAHRAVEIALKHREEIPRWRYTHRHIEREVVYQQGLVDDFNQQLAAETNPSRIYGLQRLRREAQDHLLFMTRFVVQDTRPLEQITTPHSLTL